LCDDDNPCTHDYYEGEQCESEAAPDTLNCFVDQEAGRCQAGSCMILPPCDDGNPCTDDFLDDITCFQIPKLDMTECMIGGQTGQCQGAVCEITPP
jgi:hypothetical protein